MRNWRSGRRGLRLRSVAVVTLTIVALVLAQIAAVGAAFASSNVAVPCHPVLSPSAVMTPDPDCPEHPGKSPMPDCPMMRGATCQALCALPAPPPDAIALAVAEVPRAWSRSARIAPQIVPPPQRPPNRL